MTTTSQNQSGDRDTQPSTMNSQPTSFLVQIKEIVGFEEELAAAKN
jgi:hypothetical protein